MAHRYGDRMRAVEMSGNDAIISCARLTCWWYLEGGCHSLDVGVACGRSSLGVFSCNVA